MLERSSAVFSRWRYPARSEDIRSADQHRAARFAKGYGQSLEKCFFLAGERRKVSRRQGRKSLGQTLGGQRQVGGFAGQLHRPGVENGHFSPLAHRLTQGQGEHRSLGEGIGTDQQEKIAVAEIVQAARPLAQRCRGEAGSAVPFGVQLEGRRGVAQRFRPALQQKAGLQGRARRAEKRHRRGAMPGDDLTQAPAHFVHGLRPARLAAGNPGRARALGVVGMAVAEAAPVADEMSVGLKD